MNETRRPSLAVMIVTTAIVLLTALVIIRLIPTQEDRNNDAYDACWDAIGRRVSDQRQPQVGDTEISAEDDTITVLGSFSTRTSGNRPYRCEVTDGEARLVYLGPDR